MDYPRDGMGTSEKVSFGIMRRYYESYASLLKKLPNNSSLSGQRLQFSYIGEDLR